MAVRGIYARVGATDHTDLDERSLNGLDKLWVLRRDLWSKTVNISVRRDEELLKVPANVTAVTFGVGHGTELGVDGVTVLAIHIDLLEERERHAVGGGTERHNFLIGTGLLGTELIARETHHREAATGVVTLQCFESGVLRREATLRSDVHYQDGGALEVGK